MFKMKKSILALVSLLVVLGVTVGGTIAFLIDTSGPVKNIFKPSEVTTEVTEDITTPGVKKDVKITNTGDTEAYIRAAVVINWQDKDGNVYGTAPVASTETTEGDYTISFNLTDTGWGKANDGFYYFRKPVKSDDQTVTDCFTDVLITSCQPIAGKNPDGYYLTVEIIGSGIQSLPTSVVTSEWSSGVSGLASDGTTLTIN